jgi:hypothetical protein
MSGRDPRACGDKIMRPCLANAMPAAPALTLACEQRLAAAWSSLSRQAYRQIETRLGEADKRSLRTSQVQFELELRDLCAVARALAGGDGELAAASCSSDLLASRALSLAKLAGSGIPAR